MSKAHFMVCALLASPLLASAALAQLVDENLLVALPAGYKVGFQTQKNNMVMTEYVPAAQTVDDWTDMVTVQVFHHLKATPEAFKASLEKGWFGACSGATSNPVVSDVENGYPALVWFLTCPKNPSTGKPEWTWLKALQGNDSFYVVQKAFRFDPPKDQIVQWVGYLRSVKVCDARIPDRACPQTGK
jgi:hypothetical protein